MVFNGIFKIQKKTKCMIEDKHRKRKNKISKYG